jgi:hypothetical protein
MSTRLVLIHTLNALGNFVTETEAFLFVAALQQVNRYVCFGANINIVWVFIIYGG